MVTFYKTNRASKCRRRRDVVRTPKPCKHGLGNPLPDAVPYTGVRDVVDADPLAVA